MRMRSLRFFISELSGYNFLVFRSSHNPKKILYFYFIKINPQFFFATSKKTSDEKNLERPSFDDIYMTLAMNLSKRSHCVKIKVGAVIAKETRIISLGYNGPPAGTHNCDEEWPTIGCPRSLKGGCLLALHAEENAILYAAKNKIVLDNATLYLTLSPCLSCARMIFTSGITKVFFLESYASFKGLQTDEGVDFLKKFGVEVTRFSFHKN